jgi:hypothetical protein
VLLLDEPELELVVEGLRGVLDDLVLHRAADDDHHFVDASL